MTRWVQKAVDDGDFDAITIPPVRLLSACEWFPESQKEILAMGSETPAKSAGHGAGGTLQDNNQDGCLFSDINVSSLQKSNKYNDHVSTSTQLGFFGWFQVSNTCL